jgi:hypothetical protein
MLCDARKLCACVFFEFQTEYGRHELAFALRGSLKARGNLRQVVHKAFLSPLERRRGVTVFSAAGRASKGFLSYKCIITWRESFQPLSR